MNDARGFTKAQHGLFRPMVADAWKAYCSHTPSALQAVDKAAAHRAWYEAELREATGKPSTTLCDPKRDFEHAMAHFETIVGNAIYWNLRAGGGDARRIAWNIREICRANEVDEQYMQGVARRMLRLSDHQPLPELGLLQYQELIIIMGELKRFLRRGGRPYVKRNEDPF